MRPDDPLTSSSPCYYYYHYYYTSHLPHMLTHAPTPDDRSSSS